MIVRIIIFFVLNFGALAIGGMFTGKGVPSDWYVNLSKAPWSPPGWVFGVAWTTIMLFFSVYMAKLWSLVDTKRILILLYAIQWVLNISWNPAFFYYHKILLALVLIISLTILVGFLLFYYHKKQKIYSLFICPYFIWLLIATSLNGYIYLYN